MTSGAEKVRFVVVGKEDVRTHETRGEVHVFLAGGEPEGGGEGPSAGGGHTGPAGSAAGQRGCGRPHPFPF